MNEHDEMTREEAAVMRAAQALPKEIAPPHDLWPSIEAAITRTDARRDRRWHRWLAQAAAVVLLVGGSSGVTWYALEGGRAGAVADGGVASGLEFDLVAGSFGGRYHLGPDFVDARASLAAGLDEKLAQLPPETRLAVEQNIAEIRAAIGEINRALANEPDNRLLQDLLMDAYREELTLMKKVDTIARTGTMHRPDI
jgi:hypothetical protein